MGIHGNSIDLQKNITQFFDVNQKRLYNLNEKLRLLDPQNILQRGFTISSQNGVILKSAKQVSEFPELETRFSDGTIKSRIINNEQYGDK